MGKKKAKEIPQWVLPEIEMHYCKSIAVNSVVHGQEQVFTFLTHGVQSVLLTWAWEESTWVMGSGLSELQERKKKENMKLGGKWIVGGDWRKVFGGRKWRWI